MKVRKADSGMMLLHVILSISLCAPLIAMALGFSRTLLRLTRPLKEPFEHSVTLRQTPTCRAQGDATYLCRKGRLVWKVAY